MMSNTAAGVRSSRYVVSYVAIVSSFRSTVRSDALALNEVERDLPGRCLGHRRVRHGGERREETVLLEGVHRPFRVPHIYHEDRSVCLFGRGVDDHPVRSVVAQAEHTLHGVVEVAGWRRADLDDGHRSTLSVSLHSVTSVSH